MISEARVEGSATLRLFYGLPLPDVWAGELARWAGSAFSHSTGVRTLEADNLHVTLAFLGGRPARELDALRAALHEAAEGVPRPELDVEGYRETERVGMVVLGDRDGVAGRLQAQLSACLAGLGVYRPERRPWLAHVTVARFRERPRLKPSPPQLERVSPSEAALYHSVLRSGGAQYHIVEAVSLGG